MYFGMRGVTVLDMAKGVEDVQAIIGEANSRLGTDLRLAVGLSGAANRLVVAGGYPDLDSLINARSQIGMDPDLARRMAAAASNVEAGSGSQYIIRHIHGSTERGTGDFIYFRAVQNKPGRMAEALPSAIGIVDHLTDAHGWTMSVGTPLGDIGDTLLFATRFTSANDVDAAFDTLMGDEKYQEMAASAIELAQGIQDRFLMLLPN